MGDRVGIHTPTSILCKSTTNNWSSANTDAYAADNNALEYRDFFKGYDAAQDCKSPL